MEDKNRKVWLPDVFWALNGSKSVLVVNYADMVEELNKIPTAEEWISVKDQLPEDGEMVLMCKKLKSGRCSIDLGYYMSQFTVYDADLGRNVDKPTWVTRGNNVTHWMKIPDPPEEV